jgi:Phage integrase family
VSREWLCGCHTAKTGSRLLMQIVIYCLSDDCRRERGTLPRRNRQVCDVLCGSDWRPTGGARRSTQASDLAMLGIRQDGQSLVCGQADGQPLQPRSLTHEFTRLVKRIVDLPRIRFHDLRHSHATQMLLAGVHPKIAQERLGHSTITTTLDLYSHVTDTMQSDAAARLDAAFRIALKGPAAAE